jgi:hypothetical protein
MNPMPEYQPIEPLEPMNNNPSGKSRIKQRTAGHVLGVKPRLALHKCLSVCRFKPAFSIIHDLPIHRAGYAHVVEFHVQKIELMNGRKRDQGGSIGNDRGHRDDETESGTRLQRFSTHYYLKS